MNTRTLSDRELLSELRRHGFKEGRHTTHGIMWMMRTYRFLTPGLRGGSTFIDGSRHAEARTRDWIKLTEAMYREIPGYRDRMTRQEAKTDIHAEVAAMQPVMPEVTAKPRAEEPLVATLPAPEVSPPEPAEPEEVSMAKSERERITAALREAKGQRHKAAKILGWSSGHLYRRIEEYGIKVPVEKGWTCPHCGEDFRVAGRHESACPVRLERERAGNYAQSGAGPLADLPRPVPTPKPAGQPVRPDFTVKFEITDRPVDYVRARTVLSPYVLALRETESSGKALCIRNLSEKQIRTFRSIGQYDCGQRNRSFHTRTQNGTLWAWTGPREPSRTVKATA